MASEPENIDVWNTPALQPPPNVIPDFAHPGGDGNLAAAVIIVCGVAAGIAFCVRLASRFIVRRVYIEDGLFFATLGLYAGFMYEIYIMDSKYYHVREWNISLHTLSNVLFATHVMTLLYGLTVMLLKVAILLSWLRLFVPMKQRNAMFWTLHALIWTNIIFYTVGTFCEIFRCTPREKIWNPVFVGGYCSITLSTHAKGSGFINLLSDVIILLFPQTVIWRLHVTPRQKIGLSLLFVVGVFAVATATVRIYYLIREFSSSDLIYNGSDLVLWMAAEISAGFLVMGLPSLPNVVRALPGSGSMMSFFKGSSSSGGEERKNSRRGLPSWFKPSPRGRGRRGDSSIMGTTRGGSQADMVFVTSWDPSTKETTTTWGNGSSGNSSTSLKGFR
ncbi:hypothetical protein PISL3812_01146 [Talaromyces islandicus]|uniref:Rhodopsin domain-containing protein n=1 Tax=Talaromyces islandicus TaxID=28573 RepID=A0A0U1LND8_TALIS|nr:hypothetical protein PISL3812_01146 [Talaromyces islandicus]